MWINPMLQIPGRGLRPTQNLKRIYDWIAQYGEFDDVPESVRNSKLMGPGIAYVMDNCPDSMSRSQYDALLRDRRKGLF